MSIRHRRFAYRVRRLDLATIGDRYPGDREALLAARLRLATVAATLPWWLRIDIDLTTWSRTRKTS